MWDSYNHIATINCHIYYFQNHPLQNIFALHMAKNPNVMHKEGNDEPTIFLNQLERRVDALIIFIVGWTWDVINTYGKYMSMEYIISDEKVT